MKNIKIRLIIGLIFFVLGLLYAPKLILAYNEYQKCDKETSCTVGEFLYDDSYVPIATATCRFTSRYPNGNIFINGVETDSTTDGWYSIEVQATGSAGLYRSQLCCESGTDYLCLDKSFKIEATTSALTKTDVSSAVWDEPRANHTQSGSFGEALQNIVPSASDIATAVWGYSNKTLSSFGSLPTDVWNSTARTLTSFGDLVQSIWTRNERTLTSSGVDTSSLAKKTEVDALKTEVLYNQSLLEKMVNKPIIKNFLEEEKDVNLESKLNQSQLYLTKLFADSYSLDSKLGMVDVKWKEFDEKKLILVLKDVTKLNSSITESAKKIRGLWNLALADNLVVQAETLKNRAAIIESDLKVEGRSRIVLEDFRSLSASLDSLITTLGSSSDKAGKETLYSKINEIKALADKFDLYNSDVDKLLADWRKYQLADVQKKTDTIADNLAKINRLPKTITILSSKPEDSLNKKLKNRLLSIKATIIANKTLLAKSTDKPFSSSWLEEGSIVFKTLLTNPSTKISQDVPLKYYLPTEVKKEDIIEVDDGLKVNYDVEKKQLYVEGIFTLGPDESKVVSVRVEDMWTINDELIASLRREAEDLIKPLEKTSYFGQGVTIKSSIDVTLDKILTSLKSAVTPENKIKNYYEAEIEIKAVKDQIKNLQDLVTQAGSFGSMAGFVGGSQAVAVWGLIIIMVAGFVFLVIYMRVLRGKEALVQEPASKKKKKTKEAVKPDVHQTINRGQMIRFAAVFFILGSVVSGLTSFAVFKAMNSRPIPARAIAKDESTKETISPIPEEKVLGAKDEEKKVTIIDLDGDYLRIRESPEGKVIGKAYSGEKYPFVKEEDGWVQIKLDDGSGWISKEFVSTP